MRGIPLHPVPCSKCGSVKGYPKDGLCNRCRIASRPNPNKRFFWTAEHDAALRRAYQNVSSRFELTSNIDRVQRGSGFTRSVVLSRASQLGLSFCRRQAWSAAEINMVRENLGVLSKASLARKLGRSYYSIKALCSRLNLSSRITEGYSHSELAELLGVNPKTVRKWVENGWLFVRSGRISEQSTERFLKSYPEEYDLRRVDAAWFKGMVFPSFGKTLLDRKSRPARPEEPMDVGSGPMELHLP